MQKVKVVVVDLYSASAGNVSKALRYGTHCQGITQLYLHTLRFIRKRNKLYLPLPPSRSWYSFGDPRGMGG